MQLCCTAKKDLFADENCTAGELLGPTTLVWRHCVRTDNTHATPPPQYTAAQMRKLMDLDLLFFKYAKWDAPPHLAVDREIGCVCVCIVSVNVCGVCIAPLHSRKVLHRLQCGNSIDKGVDGFHQESLFVLFAALSSLSVQGGACERHGMQGGRYCRGTEWHSVSVVGVLSNHWFV